jgi:hypothetical protein
MLRELSFRERQQISGRVDRLRIAENGIFDFMLVWYIWVPEDPELSKWCNLFNLNVKSKNDVMSQL